MAGLISEKTKSSVFWDIIAMLAATVIIYGVGVPWLKVVMKMTWGKAVVVGVVPFLIGDGIKIAAAIPVVRVVRPMIRQSEVRQPDQLNKNPN